MNIFNLTWANDVLIEAMPFLSIAFRSEEKKKQEGSTCFSKNVCRLMVVWAFFFEKWTIVFFCFFRKRASEREEKFFVYFFRNTFKYDLLFGGYHHSEVNRLQVYIYNIQSYLNTDLKANEVLNKCWKCLGP